MKKQFLFLALCCAMFTACSTGSDDTSADGQASVSEVILHSNVSRNDFNIICNKVDSLMTLEIASRSAGGEDVLTGENTKEILKPLMTDGERLRNEILADAKSNPHLYTQNETDSLAALTDYQLAALGLVIYSMDDGNTYSRSTGKSFIYCLEELLGLSHGSIDYIKGTKQLITATTGKVILRAFLKRTLGWISVAIDAKSLLDCLGRDTAVAG